MSLNLRRTVSFFNQKHPPAESKKNEVDKKRKQTFEVRPKENSAIKNI